MLCKMTFWLSGKVFTLHLDSSTAKAYLCNQGSTASLFFQNSLPHFESGWKTWFCSYSSIQTYQSQCWSHYLPQERLLLRLVPASSFSSGCISSLGSTGGVSVGILTYQSMSAVLPLGKSTSSGNLGVEDFQPPMDISGELCVSFPHVCSSTSVQVSGRTCQGSVQISYSSGTLLDGGSLASHHFQHFGRHSSFMSHCKRPHHGCLGRLGPQGPAITTFNLLAAPRCVYCRQGFSSLVCQVWAGITQASTNKVLSAVPGKRSGWCAPDVVPNKAIFAPKLADFLFYLYTVGLALYTVDIYYSVILAFFRNSSNHL